MPSATSSPCPQCGADRSLTDAPGICPSCLARGLLKGGPVPALLLAPPPALPEVPGWQLLRLTGGGGMGQVYQAESVLDGTPGAVKILDARWTDDPVMAARFEGEAQALRKLEHPHIVRLLDTPVTGDGRLCLVMEWVDGCDLGRLLRAEKLTPDRAMDVFPKVCAAAAHAHAQGILHRDIKPSNILAGRDGTVKLADFGLAKALAQGDGGSMGPAGLTATTDQFGTAYYLAPERMLAGHESGPPEDVFSLGVLFYHLMSGRMPLGKYEPLSKITPLPGRIDAIIANALTPDPKRRTGTVRELLESTESVWKLYCAGSDRVRLRRKLLAAAAILILLSAAGAGGAWWQWNRLRPAPPPVFSDPRTATSVSPWVNGLGMSFVPVPGLEVLMSRYETRRQDYEPFRSAVAQAMSPAWMVDNAAKVRQRSESIIRVDADGSLTFDGTWDDLGFPVAPDHPAMGIGIREAQRYCLWLTDVELKQGRLQPGQHYRLPTNEEWLTACGGRFASLQPGNLAGPEANDEIWPDDVAVLEKRDDFPRSAPVGSFPAERFGLFDMSGNVAEWVVDPGESTASRETQSSAQLRGPSFRDGTPEAASFHYNRRPYRNTRMAFVGFRLVLETKTAPASESGSAPSPSDPAKDRPD